MKARGRRRRSPAFSALHAIWHRAINPRLDRLERKIDKLLANHAAHLKSRIGFHPPSSPDA